MDQFGYPFDIQGVHLDSSLLDLEYQVEREREGGKRKREGGKRERGEREREGERERGERERGRKERGEREGKEREGGKRILYCFWNIFCVIGVDDF